MDFAENRGANFMKQFTYIFIRNVQFLFRNKASLIGGIIQMTVVSALMVGVFWQVGKFPKVVTLIPEYPYTKIDDAAYQTFVMNIRGTVLMIQS